MRLRALAPLTCFLVSPWRCPIPIQFSPSLDLLGKSGGGKGALNETSGLSRTPNSQAMFAATTKRSYLLEEINKTCDVLEEAVNLAFEGRPGPVHIHVAEDLTLEGQSVENYRVIRLNVRPV